MTTTAIVISTEVGGIGINGRMPWLELFSIVKEFVVYEEDIDLTSIQYHWNDRRLLGEGVDNNQNFEIWHYRKKV